MSTCNYWVGSDTTGHRCRTETAERYCEKHYPIVRRRVAALVEKRAQQEAKANAAWKARNLHNLPTWRVQLESAEAEYVRRTSSPIQDRAAVGGNMHGAIVRTQRSHLSDSNVARIVELERIIKRLRADIARAERGAA